jgi:hypothetical protein
MGEVVLDEGPPAQTGFSAYLPRTAGVRQLLAYFSGNRRLCASYGIDLQKGLWLTGPEGCGKSTIMEFFSHNALVPFGLFPAGRSCGNFYGRATRFWTVTGKVFQPIYAGAAVEFDRTRPLTWCFDELGMELPVTNLRAAGAGIVGNSAGSVRIVPSARHAHVCHYTSVR